MRNEKGQFVKGFSNNKGKNNPMHGHIFTENEIKKRSDGAKRAGVGKWMKGSTKEKHNNWKGGKNSETRAKYAPRPKPNQCEICGAMGRICYDHDHSTGKFRGWICIRCNSTLGFVKDNTETLMALIEYIKKNKNNGQGK